MEKDEGDPEKLQSYVNTCLRFILGIWWPNVISDEDLWERTRQKETWKEIRYQKWKWIGHMLRQDNESIDKKPSSGTYKQEGEEDPGLHGEAR
jgi:hypothetical protein